LDKGITGGPHLGALHDIKKRLLNFFTLVNHRLKKIIIKGMGGMKNGIILSFPPL
jgi:hypothetical protein